MPTPNLRPQVPRLAAKRRLAASSVTPVYASALSYTHFCVIPNANAYRFSLPVNVISSGGGR
jgi:hypothetical protein